MQARLTQFEAQMAEAHNAVQANKLGFALLTYEILLAKCADLPTRIAILSGKANANSKLCIVREGPHVQRSLRDCITILDDLKSLGHLKPSLLHARNLMELERLPEAIQWCNAVMSQATSVLEERGPVDLVNTVLKRLKYFCQEDKTFGQAASSRKGIDDSVLKNSVELIKARELFTTAMYQRPISYHSIGLGEVNTWLTLPCCVAKSRSITETFTTSMESAPTASNPLK
ncbi:hypothetical protein DL93DRAFT_2152442 [Clavulina sp. PMI_390]|nr:hypothetical protein DL93DRAFT_2152442 [Clavulina sp. PMI_390]